MSPPSKSNAVLEEQIKMLFQMMAEIKDILTSMKDNTVSKDQLKSALDLHEALSKARHDRLESDIVILKRIIYTLGTGVIVALGKSFASLFSFIIK